MSRFIRLSNKLINISQIVKIDIFNEPKSYHLVLNPINISGYHIFSFGSISSYDTSISIYEETNQEDYKIMTDWINKINNDE